MNITNTEIVISQTEIDELKRAENSLKKILIYVLENTDNNVIDRSYTIIKINNAYSSVYDLIDSLYHGEKTLTILNDADYYEKYKK